MGAVGDIAAEGLQRIPHPIARGAGHALDAADVLSVQSRVVTTGQNQVTETYTRETLWNVTGPNPSSWTEVPGARSPGVLIGTQRTPLWSY